MNTKRVAIILGSWYCLGLLLGVGNAAAKTDKAAYRMMQIVYAEEKKHRTRDVVMEMVVRDVKKRERRYYFRSRKLQELPTLSKTMVRFFRPTSISGTSLLSWRNDRKNKISQWLYLPVSKSVRQLSSRDGNGSFIGSEFSYADMAGRQLDQDKHTALQRTGKLFFIQSVPKSKADAYSKIVHVIDIQLRITRRMVFYDRQGRKLKTLDNTDITNVKGANIITKAVMTNHQSGGYSEVNVNDISVGVEISPDEVGLQYFSSN